MSWILDNTEVATLIVMAAILILIIGFIIFIALKKTPQVIKEDKPIGKVKEISLDDDGGLSAVVEMYGDFPPLPPYNIGFSIEGQIINYDEARKEMELRNGRTK